MERSVPAPRKPPAADRGFSILELVVSIALILIMSAVAIPAIMSTLRFYQLNDKATQLAGMVKFTRFEAIRRNKAVTCQILQTGTNWTIWVDSNNNGTPDPTEAQMILTGNTNLLPSAPSPAPINAVVGPNLTAISGANASITFDPRGAVNFGAAATTVYALYIGAAGDPTSGFRAVIVMPSGSTQVWAASASGDWHRVG